MRAISSLAAGDFDGAIEIAAEMSAAGKLTHDYVRSLARVSGDPDRFFAELDARKIEMQELKPPASDQ